MSLALAVLLAGALGADSKTALHYHHYQSDSGVLAVTPAFDFSTDVDARTAVALQYNLDAVSAASFNYAQSKTHRNGMRAQGSCWTCHASTDALSGASRFYSESRQGLKFKVTRKNEDISYGVGAVLNRENDYKSDMASIRFEGTALKQNLTLALEAQLAQDQVGAVTRKLDEGMQTTAVEAMVTGILTPLTVLQGGWSFAEFIGFQHNPYAWIQVGLLDTAPVRAEHPRRRQRQVATLSLKQGLGWESSLQADYRYYSDSWEVLSHTLDLTLSKQWGKLLFEPSFRHYSQPRGAWFFQNRYMSPSPFYSRDLKLAAHSTNMASFGIRGSFTENWGCQLSYSRYLRQDSLYFADKPESADIYQIVFTFE